jgi:hypothetical protein
MRSLLCLFLLALAGSALATCPAVPPTYFVGPLGNANCNFSTIAAAVAAADTCPAVIEVSREQQYKAISVSIRNQSLTIAGTDVCGNISSSTTYTELVGDDIHSVLNIADASFVTLRNLSVHSGRAGAGLSGGGINYFGTGSLSLANVEVRNNAGGYGAGVSYVGSGNLYLDGVKIHDNSSADSGGGLRIASASQGEVDVAVVEDPLNATEIRNNLAAGDGGGLLLSGNVHFTAASSAEDQFLVHDNQAGGKGGAVYLTGAVMADLGVPFTSVRANKAVDGGAFALVPTSAGTPRLRLFGTRAGAPGPVSNNVATNNGGALYLGSGSSAATVCAFDIQFNSNQAKLGGTVAYAQSNAHLAINPEGDASCSFSEVAALGARHCEALSNCQSLVYNVASDGTNPTSAAMLLATGSASISVRRAAIQYNTGGPLVQTTAAAGGSVSLRDCLIDQNSGADYLIDNDGAAVTLDGCTLALNSVNQYPLKNRSGTISLRRSIVQEFEPLYDSGTATGITLQYMILNSQTLPTDATVLYGDAGLVDRTNGDFHLSSTSLARDFAPAGNDSPAGDLDGQPRNVDLGGVGNRFGSRDLGAYETQVGGVLDRIFLGDFQ